MADLLAGWFAEQVPCKLWISAESFHFDSGGTSLFSHGSGRVATVRRAASLGVVDLMGIG